MAKDEKTEPEYPAEFASGEQYDDHIASLHRELAGAQRRVAELEGTDATAETIQGAESAVTAVCEQLAGYGYGQESATKRPAASKTKETR